MKIGWKLLQSLSVKAKSLPEIIYIDSNKKFVRAGISFKGIPTRVPKFEQFMKRFIRFLNESYKFFAN